MSILKQKNRNCVSHHGTKWETGKERAVNARETECSNFGENVTAERAAEKVAVPMVTVHSECSTHSVDGH